MALAINPHQGEASDAGLARSRRLNHGVISRVVRKVPRPDFGRDVSVEYVRNQLI
jgi:hypothetical protein